MIVYGFGRGQKGISPLRFRCIYLDLVWIIYDRQGSRWDGLANNLQHNVTFIPFVSFSWGFKVVSSYFSPCLSKII